MNNDQEENIEFLNAAAAVYTWVSCADGEITKAEYIGFLDYVNTLEYINEIPYSRFEEVYESLLDAFKDDFDDGLNRAITRIETFKGDLQKSQDLIRIARKALVVDGDYDEVEDNVLKEIAAILGIDEIKVI